MTTHTRQPTALGRVLRGLAALLARVVRGIGALGGLGGLLVGLPWLSITYVGSPLPDHVPSIEELKTWLSPGAFTTDVFIDVLAIAVWIIWALFVLDVLVCVVHAARGIRWPDVEVPSGLRSPAAVLVGWLVFALLGPRTPDPGPIPAAPLDWAVSPVVATAPQYPGPSQETRPSEAVVRAPRDGVHDSLWAIAERHLGDGTRWNDIWELNQYRTQNDGRVFSNPHLIQPGWRLALPEIEQRFERPENPAAPPSSAPGHPDDPTAGANAPAEEPEATGTPTPAPAPDDHVTDEAGPTRDGPGIDLGHGVFLSLGVAAAISAALLLARRRFRRYWVPGRSSYDPMPVAPVVYELRLAHVAATQLDDEDDDEKGTGTAAAGPAELPAVIEPEPATPSAVDEVPLGVRDGLPVATRLVRRGLGLVGPGTDPAARALVVALLTTEDTQVVVPFDDLPRLVGHDPDRLPTTLRVVPDLGTALALLDPTTRADGAPRRVLVASSPAEPADIARLGAILAPGNSAAAAILLGQHQPGASVYVDDDGTVAATNPGPAEALRGTRLFTATAPATADLLDLLAAADPHLPPRKPDDRPPEEQDPPTPMADTGHRPGLAPEPSGDAPAISDGAAPAQPPREVRSSEPSATPEPEPAEHRATRPAARLHLRVLGPFTATVTRGDAKHVPVRFRPKVHEVLTYLALHRDGVSRATLVHDLWPHASRGPRPTNNLNRTLRHLRDAIETTGVDPAQVVLATDGRLRLNPTVVKVDYWECEDARSAARTAGRDEERRTAYQGMVEVYGGRLGADLVDAEWATGPAYTTQCAVVDALGRLATDAETSDPQRALDLLETARGFDPTNETLYTRILRLQARLGYHDAIERTLSLLATELAAQKDRPSPEIDGLVRSLRRRYTTETAIGTNGTTASRNGRKPTNESAAIARSRNIPGVE